MLLLVELSVEQKKGKLAKDALYQYKNICQNTNVGTIEVRWLSGRKLPGVGANRHHSLCSRNSLSLPSTR